MIVLRQGELVSDAWFLLWGEICLMRKVQKKRLFVGVPDTNPREESPHETEPVRTAAALNLNFLDILNVMPVPAARNATREVGYKLKKQSEKYLPFSRSQFPVETLMYFELDCLVTLPFFSSPIPL